MINLFNGRFWTWAALQVILLQIKNLKGTAMIRYIIDLDDLGYEASWLLTQQALGMPDSKMQSDFLSDRVALLLFFRSSMPERLCITAAFRQMSGSTIFQSNPQEGWGQEYHSHRELLIPIFAYYLDVIYTYGLASSRLRDAVPYMQIPLINAGSEDAHPAHALADLACILRYVKTLEGLKTAWVGGVNGTLHSLVQAAAWFKFSVKAAVPENADINGLIKKAASSGADISFTHSPEEAVRGADFIYAGFMGDLNDEQRGVWRITPKLMKLADPQARLLLCASPLRAITISDEILKSKAALLTRQAEYRLRVHKRILHWIFQKRAV